MENQGKQDERAHDRTVGEHTCVAGSRAMYDDTQLDALPIVSWGMTVCPGPAQSSDFSGLLSEFCYFHIGGLFG